MACSAQEYAACAVIFARSDLVFDRSRELVGFQSPTACATRAGGYSGPNFENCDLFHAQFPDVGRGVHARSAFTPVRRGRTGTSTSSVSFTPP